MNISESQKEQFREEGYLILEEVIPPQHLQMLRDKCQHAIDEMDARMDREGTDVIFINRRGNRYFVANNFKQEPKSAKSSVGIRIPATSGIQTISPSSPVGALSMTCPRKTGPSASCRSLASAFDHG
jgi:hypothetical protein